MTDASLTVTMRHRPGTFSIAVREPETGTFGAAVTTATVAVGATCPHVSPNAALLTQAFTLTDHGPDALARVDASERVEWIIDEYGLPARAENAITDRDDLFAELERIREQSYALNAEEEITGLRLWAPRCWTGTATSSEP